MPTTTTATAVSDRTAIQLKADIANFEVALEELSLGQAVSTVRHENGWAEYTQAQIPALRQLIADYKNAYRAKVTGEPTVGPIHLVAGR